VLLLGVIEFRVMPENTLLVEGNTSIRLEIGVEAWLRGDAIVQRDDPGKVPFEPRHRSWKGVAQAGNKLKQRQVEITDPAPDEMPVALRVAFENPLEIAKIFPELSALGVNR
jgi:hypothetical protein